MEMMNALDDSGGVEAISRELGVDQQTAKSGLSALLPAVLDGLRGQTGGGGGLGGLGAILGSLGGGGLLSNVLAPQPTDVSQGNDVLGKIFGSKEVSREVAADAAQKSGVSSDLLKKMLPIVAMLAAGYVAKRIGEKQVAPAGASAPVPEPEADGGLLGSLLNAGGSGGILGSILGGMKR